VKQIRGHLARKGQKQQQQQQEFKKTSKEKSRNEKKQARAKQPLFCINVHLGDPKYT
jgi:hypothetical protein